MPAAARASKTSSSAIPSGKAYPPRRRGNRANTAITAPKDLCTVRCRNLSTRTGSAAVCTKNLCCIGRGSAPASAHSCTRPSARPASAPPCSKRFCAAFRRRWRRTASLRVSKGRLMRPPKRRRGWQKFPAPAGRSAASDSSTTASTTAGWNACFPS